MPVGPGDFVKVTYEGRDVPVRNKEGDTLEVNHNTDPFTIMWDSKPYVLEPGKPAFVPFEAVMTAFGDPRSGANMASVRDVAGNVMFVLDRATEVRRLQTLYDNQFGAADQILYAPQAKVEDLDGNEVKTVLDDPTGETVTPVTTTILDREELLAQLQRQQRMIETLASNQGINLESPEVVQEPAPEDTPAADPFAQPPEDTGK